MPVMREDLASDDRAGWKLHLPKSGKRGRRWESHRRIVHGIPVQDPLRGRGGRRPLARLIAPGQRADAPQLVPVVDLIHVGRLGGGRVRHALIASGATTRTRPAASAATCVEDRSGTPSPNRRSAGRPSQPGQERRTPHRLRHHHLQRRTKQSERSTPSRAPVPWPRDTTTGPTACTPPSSRPPFGSGSGRDYWGEGHDGSPCEAVAQSVRLSPLYSPHNKIGRRVTRLPPC